jgi:NAD(P)-dependent dehydrogenase (short-subunit alcohol dehydrogenase family)
MRVLVTGAAGGIGAAIVAHLAERGHDVLATDLPNRLPGASRGVLPLALDVTSSDSVARAADVAREGGGVDALVHAAGVFLRRPLFEMSDDEARRIFEVNVLGALRVAKTFASMMAERGGGHIVFIGSIAATKGATHASAYAASKAALAGAARSLATELGPLRVRVNTVHPGFIDTEMLGDARNATIGYVRFRVPSRRLGRTDEVAAAVGALLASSAEYWTGSEITVDGGLSLT